MQPRSSSACWTYSSRQGAQSGFGMAPSLAAHQHPGEHEQEDEPDDAELRHLGPFHVRVDHGTLIGGLGPQLYAPIECSAEVASFFRFFAAVRGSSLPRGGLLGARSHGAI